MAANERLAIELGIHDPDFEVMVSVRGQRPR